MKTRFFLSAGLGFLILAASCTGKKEVTVRFTNPLDTDLGEEVIHITSRDYVNTVGDVPAGKLPVFIAEGDTLPSQNVDADGNGTTDEYLVLLSLPANGSLKATVHYVAVNDFPVFKSRTNIRFARYGEPGREIDSATRAQTTDTDVTQKIFQMEGPAWENDRVGFRNYFDLRNGTDIFGKRTREMVLDSVGLNREIILDNGLRVGAVYHNLSDWGMDILKVGNSLGAGSIALSVDDSMYRIGDNGIGTYHPWYEGPLESEFSFGFTDWKAAGKTFNISQYITITAGEYCYKSSLVAENAEDNMAFVTGIVNKHSDSLLVEKVSENYTALLTYAEQSEDTAYLAMGLLIPDEELLAHGKTRDTGEGITETYYAKLKAMAGTPSEYWFYAFWATGNPDFNKLGNVLKVIRKDAALRENPVKLTRID